MTQNVIILGAAGRDFHDFLVYFRPREELRVVAFTAEQIPGIESRRFPAALAGPRYPEGIPIHPERDLPRLVEELAVDVVCFAYSDVSNQQVMQKAATAMRAGANFLLLGPRDTYVAADKPVIAVTAVRTGCGKSQTARAIGEILRGAGRRPVAIRHSMPYGADLTRQTCQRFATAADFARHETTIEEEEEYQPWLDHGFPVFAGFDYREIVGRASQEGDILIFDGGNNDVSMIRPDLQVTVVDPHRAGHETTYYPGYLNLLLADVVLINKIDSARAEDVAALEATILQHNPSARILRARSEIKVADPERIRGRRCVVIGDGPTLSHGGMVFGAGTLAVESCGGNIVDPRAHLVGSLRTTYAKYPHLGREIPAMGYGPAQIRDLRDTVNAVPGDVVVDGSPANLERTIEFNKPVVQVGYELGEAAVQSLTEVLRERGLA